MLMDKVSLRITACWPRDQLLCIRVEQTHPLEMQRKLDLLADLAVVVRIKLCRYLRSFQLKIHESIFAQFLDHRGSHFHSYRRLRIGLFAASPYSHMLRAEPQNRVFTDNRHITGRERRRNPETKLAGLEEHFALSVQHEFARHQVHGLASR